MKGMVINMEKAKLFPQMKGLLHGGDYNPDQWLDRPDILKEDIRLMKKAGVNSVSMGIFSWMAYEPEEGKYQFDWMEKLMDDLYENGIYTILATPSGARPAWMDEKYPEVMRVDNYGVRNHHGIRHNHCMTSPVYREKVAQMNERLAKRFGKHPGLIMWHLSNEYGGECYCDLCVKKFQKFLEEKYDHDIDQLNHAWWNHFWSHRYTSFSQIEPPFINGERSSMGLDLDWKRFTTYNTNDFMKEESVPLKKITPDIPVTTNFMTVYDGLDYRKMADTLDVISWDSYPSFHNDYESLWDTCAFNSFNHVLMRSMKKDKPFMLMESAPGLVSWQPFNKLKKPGIHKLACMQAIACGSDTVQYFQWRKSRGSFEQYHGAVVDHQGDEHHRVFKEVAQVGELMEKIGDCAGTLVKAKTALLFDWDTRWAIADMQALSAQTKKYDDTCIGIWKEFLSMGVEMDIIDSESDFSDYDVIVAPMPYMIREKVGENLTKFVERGGQLLSTYLTGYVNENQLCYLGGFPGAGLKELFGIRSDEIDTLYPTDRNEVIFSDKTVAEVKDYAELLTVSDATVLGTYGQDFYEGSAAVTVKSHGAGNAYYVAARLKPADMRTLFIKILEDAKISYRTDLKDIEIHTRVGENGSYTFYLNHSEEEKIVSDVCGVDLVTDQMIENCLKLEKYGVAIIYSQK